MTCEIEIITVENFLGKVNCYLLKKDTGFILIDTGWSNKREYLEKELENLGCSPDNLKLIILTHGDFDHSGNSAYLSRKFNAKIAMHSDDSGMIEQGDMFWNRKKANVLIRITIKALSGISGLKPEKFKPDLNLDEGNDLSEYGFDAKVIHVPGHSKGSIGILTDEGNFFCGDLLENLNKPASGSIIDDPEEFYSSIEKLGGLKIKTVYPGHGKPFPMELLIIKTDKKQKGSIVKIR